MSRPSSDADHIIKELTDIKKLISLFLLKTGATQTEIGGVLGVDQSRVSRILGGRKIVKYKDS